MGTRINLDHKLDLRGSENLLDALRGSEGDVVLDARDVVHFGTQAAQTVMVAARDFAGSGRRVMIENLAPEATAQLERLGLPLPRLTNGG